MEPLKLPKNDKESRIQKRIIDFMTLRGWFVKSTHGNAYQSGFPDLFCCHQSYGIRWVEVKVPVKYRFTKAQLTVFTAFAARNHGVWVMTSEKDYECLMRAANWHTFLWKSSGITLEHDVAIIPKSGPEALIQNAIIAKLKADDWFCIETYGSLYQSGFPDIFAVHKKHGCKWIECKNPKKYSFTPAQIRTFPRFSAEGVGIWILTSVSEIPKLFETANWSSYLK